MTTAIVPRVSGGEEEHGHLTEFRTDPIGLMNRIREECGDVGWFQLVDKHVIFLSGAEANEFFFRSADEDLDQAEAYPFMTPIFGKGVVFDASPERRKEMLHNSALRGEQMKGHAATIEGEVEKMIAGWADEGEIELLDFFSELTIYTSTACLIGLKFREQLDHRFAEYYHELERGTDPLCYVDPYLPIESFQRRDEAREARCAGSGNHGGSAVQPAEGQGRPRHARRAGVDPRRGGQRPVLRGRGHRHVHLADVRGPPHQFGDVVVDSHRAHPPP
jgi:sterol 14alpha-demethylase